MTSISEDKSGQNEEKEYKEKIRQEREIEKNKVEALNMAEKIFKIISHPDIVKKTTPDQRHKLCIRKAKNFASAYPLILAKMARDLKYNSKAFRKFLDKLHEDPGKGMEGFVERQADYVKFLYMEDCKAHNRHWNIKTANYIWNAEYNHMYSWVKKMKKKEDEITNEYEEEEKTHLEERKLEFLDWLNTEIENNKDKYKQYQTENINDYEHITTNKLEHQETNEEPIFDKKVRIKEEVKSNDNMALEELKTQINYLKSYEKRLTLEIQQKDAIIAKYEKNLDFQQHKDFLEDTLISKWKKNKCSVKNNKKRNKKNKR